MKNFTQLKRPFYLLLLLFITLVTKAQTTSQTFATSSSFTVPIGITQVTVEAFGGGGKGGSRASGTGAYGGGGGGAYSRKLVTVIPGNTYAVTVGTGATLNIANGNDSWFINATTILAKGGGTVPSNSSLGALGGSAALSIGDITFSGGNGANGVLGSYGGGGGSSAGNAFIGTSATVAAGAIAPAGGGNGGNGRSTTSGNGSAGVIPGGGGGGALALSGGPTGGNGANGRVIITYDIPEINILGNATSIADGDITPTLADWTDFGTTGVGVGITRTFTIENTASIAPLSIGAITFSGANAADFSVTTPPSALVPFGGSTTFVVTFNPSAAGISNATISIANNDINENPYDFALTGTTSAQEINIQGNSTTIVDGDAMPSATDFTIFGSTDVASGTLTQTFTIQNTGSATLTIGAINFAGANASDFSVTTAPSASVAAGSFTTFVVTFNPSGAGVRNATILIINNDIGENPYDFAIQGTGTEQEINVQGNSLTITDGDATPTTLDFTDFGGIDVAIGSINRLFTIQNTGTSTLSIGAISFSGVNPADFSVVTPPSASLTAGNSTTFTIAFNPSAVGIRTAIISIINNDSNENPYDFTIQGIGLEPEINILGNGISIVDGDITPVVTDWTDFSNLTTLRTFTIQNTGGVTLNIGAISLSGTNASEFTIQTPPSSSIIPGGSSTFVIKFTPTAVGIRTATITIANNDTNENPYNFSLQGTGVLPNMNVRGNTIIIPDGDITPSTTDWTNWNATNVNSPITRVYTIQNTGTMNLNLTGAPLVAISGSPDFTVTTPPTSPVQGIGTVTFTVTFWPLTTGTKVADISIANNDAGLGKNPYTFRITCDAVETYIDSDNDGVLNNVDSDDDNDGIPDNIEQNYASGSVLGTSDVITLLNETFGEGIPRTRIYSNIPTATTTYCYEDGLAGINSADECNTDYSLNDGQYTINYEAGSSAMATWAPTYWYQGPDHTAADVNGRMALFNATNDITEEFYKTTIIGVITNAPLTYSFWVLNLDRSNAPGIATRNRPNLSVEFRDLSTNLISVINTGNIAPTSFSNAAGDWYYFSATFIPVTTGFTITFRNNQPGGAGNDLALDDIRIVQTITDSDQDGLGDVYDLDSDNDGIGGIVEDGWSSLSNGYDRMDLTATWLDADVDGWHDTVQATYGSNGNVAADFDTDGLPNYIDLDSDNDSRFDVDEASLLNGDGDVNGDGVGEGTDTDQDGILSAFDVLSGYGNTGKALPVNTLATGNPDYLKVMSNTGVYDISTTLFASLDANNNGIIDGSIDADKDGILDAFDTSISVYGSPRDLNRKLLLDFDGRNDYAQNTPILGGLANASLMAWIDLNNTFVTEGVIVGQDKFQIRINSAKKLEAVANTTTVVYNAVTLNTSQWYHVGAVYGGGVLKLYLNGNMVASSVATGNIAADATNLTIGKNPLLNNKFFKGKIDEVRVFSVALTDAQFQRMVYQEVQNTSAQVRGTIVPKDIGTLPFTNMLRCYRMDTYKNDIVDDISTATIDIGSGMKMYNHKNIYVQQAPMPFVTQQTGNFASAVNSVPNDIRGQDIMDFDWSIVQVRHDITENSNSIDLGMIVDSGKTVNMINDTKLQNDWYLKLDGKIDLVGKSQLIQSLNSDLDVTSSGSLERDQQGQNNLYNYNFWSSPVSSINSTTINHGYTVNGVMKDGTTTTPQNITWTSGYNGAPTSPITLSSYWIFKYQNLGSNYYNWQSVGQNGTLLASQGYTLKGSGSATNQNYTFIGKPNNGVISGTISANNLNLSGNPYPSALDANAFITANTSTTTGALYFWEHYSTNNTHETAQYQGGYAMRTLVGGTPPVSPPIISGVGSSSKVPNRFIPVGQGFFILGSSTGGAVNFSNNQRLFVKEDHVTSFTLFKNNNATTSESLPNNDNDAVETDTFKRVRLGFSDKNGYHRQILLGFMDENATSGIDSGYDGELLDNQLSDMYFSKGNKGYNILGEGYFNENVYFKLGVKTHETGVVTFTNDGLENFDENQNIYIFDKYTEIYHNITNDNFSINLSQGISKNRFALVFNAPENNTKNNLDLNNAIQIVYTSSNNTVNIKNNSAETLVENVELYNMLGQAITNWNVINDNQQNIQLLVKNISSGTYVVKVKTNKGFTSRKIIF